MASHKGSGKVQTVTGPINPDELGVTLSHEHIICDSSFRFKEAENKDLAYGPVRIEKLAWYKQNQHSSLDNFRLLDEDTAISELTMFKESGGGTVIDMGNIGLCRDPMVLVRISEATGVNIVMGAGYYVGNSHPSELATRSVESISEEIVRDIMVGVGNTGVNAGVIGEIGCSYPLMETEVKVLEASAIAQRETGAPVNIHPGQSRSSPMEIIDRLSENGGDIDHTAMSHVGNRHGMDMEYTVKLAETGCYIEYDSFGNHQGPIILPEKTFFALSDWQRVLCIKELIENGFLDQLLISHDVFYKTALCCYGGYGYDHINRTVKPLMHMNGINDNEIHAMLVDNPKRFFKID
jgi:phosphotriesterase-related protein